MPLVGHELCIDFAIQVIEFDLKMAAHILNGVWRTTNARHIVSSQLFSRFQKFGTALTFADARNKRSNFCLVLKIGLANFRDEVLLLEMLHRNIDVSRCNQGE